MQDSEMESPRIRGSQNRAGERRVAMKAKCLKGDDK